MLQITRRGNRDNLGMITFLKETHVVTLHYKHLSEAVLMRGHKICFHSEIKKILPFICAKKKIPNL